MGGTAGPGSEGTCPRTGRVPTHLRGRSARLCHGTRARPGAAAPRPWDPQIALLGRRCTWGPGHCPLPAPEASPGLPLGLLLGPLPPGLPLLLLQPLLLLARQIWGPSTRRGSGLRAGGEAPGSPPTEARAEGDRQTRQRPHPQTLGEKSRRPGTSSSANRTRSRGYSGAPTPAWLRGEAGLSPRTAGGRGRAREGAPRKGKLRLTGDLTLRAGPGPAGAASHRGPSRVT